jgi:cytochrome o ubiquinol oxidase subunit 2
MDKKRKIILLLSPVVIILGLLIYYLSTHSIPVLQPAGTIAEKQKNLMVIALILAAIVVVPTYTLTILIAVRYRETNKKARYEPEWDHSNKLEAIWWGIPMVIITILSVITWKSSYALNPYKAIPSNKPTLNVEVVSLDWKWLFIYPQQGVASVNRLELPENTPVHFYITSDTVMNSFWVPALAGQIYAMPGMTTQLNLEANKLGSFYGSSANISGKGFAGMNFKAVSVKLGTFNDWLLQAKDSSQILDADHYTMLARPSEYNSVAYYKDPANGLFNAIIMQYMKPGQTIADGVNGSTAMSDMNMPSGMMGAN